MKRSAAVLAAFAGFALAAALAAPARAARELPPVLAAADLGARIEDVSLETYGVTNARVAERYLSLHAGDVLTRDGVARDYANLTDLAGLDARLDVRHRPATTAVSLHWIVLGKTFKTTDHPFYADQPLTIPIEGFGTVLTAPPVDASGATISSYTQVALRAQLARLVYTKPLGVDAARGEERDLILNTFGARGAVRATEPVTQDIYSWATAYEALYLVRRTDGTQIEAGLRTTRATSAKPTYLTAPTLFDTYDAPSRSTTLEAAFSHGCPVAPTRWYPPNCYVQTRVEAFDAIGGLGANTAYRQLFADLAQYTRLGASTLVVHGAVARTGGLLPTSALLCAYTFGYAKATCGTDTNLVQAEFRLADARPGPLKFILFTESAASRVDGSTQPFAPATFQWRADSGVGAQYRGFRFNVAYGNQGGRITYEVQGQLF